MMINGKANVGVVQIASLPSHTALDISSPHSTDKMIEDIDQGNEFQSIPMDFNSAFQLLQGIYTKRASSCSESQPNSKDVENSQKAVSALRSWLDDIEKCEVFQLARGGENEDAVSPFAGSNAKRARDIVPNLSIHNLETKKIKQFQGRAPVQNPSNEILHHSHVPGKELFSGRAAYRHSCTMAVQIWTFCKTQEYKFSWA